MASGPPVIDLSEFLKDPTSEAARKTCEQIAESLHDTSCLIVRDPRVTSEHNNQFIDLMERYYELPEEVKLKDCRPELSYQVGATPENTEVPVPREQEIAELTQDNAAHEPKGADPKWRYFWRIGDRPEKTKFQELNAAPVIPEGFDDWAEVMNRWGALMLASIDTVAEMLAVGLEFPVDTFTSLLKHGPHLLAPTGSDLGRYGELDTIFAGFHNDLNFLTIHGRSRFPGLYIWLRNGTRHLVRVPDGCLLIQAGQQMEYLTGGYVKAGWHEVVVTKETVAAAEKAKEEKRSLWRVSSTLFSHVASDNTLVPLHKFATEETLAKYPSTLAGDQVQAELDLLQLGVGGQQPAKRAKTE
eukprot:TRINITY_DN11426_c0_g1_i1.p1 TRINITY_DN11426_c0_g1~~TRINITY_DN11426_c0_g1_i1.p1  ORF type:complete len:357 (-),score=91.10 TRINITY_DN11426_c0_g1_i1:121-1191(-)